MSNRDRISAELFRKLPKKQQKEINKMGRIPTSRPTIVFDKTKNRPRKKRIETELYD